MIANVVGVHMKHEGESHLTSSGHPAALHTGRWGKITIRIKLEYFQTCTIFIK